MTLADKSNPPEIFLWFLILIFRRQSFCVIVRGDRGDDMTDPAQHSTGTDPKAGGDNQPEYSPPESAVVKLAHSRNDQT